MISMTYEEATKTIDELKKLTPHLKEFNITTRVKAEHRTKLEEARKLLYRCMEAHFIYDPEYNHGFGQYREAVEMWETKKVLDHWLNYFIISLRSDVQRHIQQLEELKTTL